MMSILINSTYQYYQVTVILFLLNLARTTMYEVTTKYYYECRNPTFDDISTVLTHNECLLIFDDPY